MNQHLLQNPEELASTDDGSSTILGFFPRLWSRLTMLAPCVSREDSGGATNTGKPEDYFVARITAAVRAFPHWPEGSTEWVHNLMKNHGEPRGIEKITQTLVE